ncbi:MAG: OmpH family outer membrane protein [Bacteroidota bacterium]
MTRLCRRSLFLAATLALFAAIALPAPLRAQLERAPVTGVIDIQGVLRASTAVQALSRGIEAQREQMQAEMQDREQALRAADLDLAQRRASLTPEAYADERNRLEAEGVDLQREAQEERRRLDQLFSQGMAQIQQVLLQISQDIARENGLDLVLAKSTVIIVRPEFDFTDEALQRLNTDLKEVPLPQAQSLPTQN